MLKPTASSLFDANAREKTSSEPMIAEPPPREEAPAGGKSLQVPEGAADPRAPAKPAGKRRVVVPRELLEEFIGYMSEQYGSVPLVGPSIRYAMRNITDNWEAEHGPNGTTIRKKPQPPNLLSGFVFNPRDPARSPARPAREAVRATPTPPEAETPEVAAANKAWDEAKRSGDPDAMTRTANALIRAVTKARAQSGAGAPQPANGRDPVSEILAPQEARQGHAAATQQSNLSGVAAQSAGEGAAVGANAVANSPAPGLGNAVARAATEGISAGANAVAIAAKGGHPTYAPPRTGRASDTTDPTKAMFTDDVLARAAAFIAQESPERQSEVFRAFEKEFGPEEAARLAWYLPAGVVDRAQTQGTSAGADRAIYEPGNPEQGGFSKLGQAPGGRFAPAALSQGEEAQLRREQNFNPSSSWDWADPPRGAPYRIVNFLRRMGFDKDRWKDFVNQYDRDDPQRRDWANPEYGWGSHQTALNLLEMGRHGSATIETLLMLSDAAYWSTSPGNDYRGSYKMPDALEDNPSFFGPDSGWERILAMEDPQTGLRIFALYNRRMRTVFISNRGTRPSLDIGDDIATDMEISNGRAPKAFAQAHDFMKKVWTEMGKRGLRGEQVVLTGHSLGGALAQLELAVANRDPALAGMRAVAVTFAALGARDAIIDRLRQKALRTEDIEQYGKTHLLNYVRAGDGYPYRGALFGPRPTGIGTTRELGGLYMQEIKKLEQAIGPNNAQTLKYLRNFEKEPLDATAHFLKLLLTERDDHRRLAILYVLNHSLRSYYRPEFSRPLRDAVPPGFLH